MGGVEILEDEGEVEKVGVFVVVKADGSRVGIDWWSGRADGMDREGEREASENETDGNDEPFGGGHSKY